MVHRRVPDHAPAAAALAAQPLLITGYHGSPTPATLRIVTFDPARRLRRALKGWAASWGAMVVSVFLPIAHFVLVPSFFLLGIWQFFRRLKQAEQVRGAHGRCPDCGAEQDFELGAGRGLRLPQGIQCRSCQRGLTLAAGGGGGPDR